MSFSVFYKSFHGIQFDLLDPYKRFILLKALNFGKMWKFLEKRPFFRADMAGLGKYCMGGYGRFGVYRVNKQHKLVKYSLCELNYHIEGTVS